MLKIPSLTAVKDYSGTSLGPSKWLSITQERIDTFANATDDHQWIHCDVERAGRESPFKTTIAHGYLTLSLAPELLTQIISIDGWKTVVNTGLEKLRFYSPVLSDSRVRLLAEIKGTRDLPNGGVRVTFAIRIEVEGAQRLALRANVVYVYLPEGATE
ncbi:MAG: MaoC family dehydratase [Myxococcales bacterium]|nr:MaoC family dehydratase [Myxococcales bacterium]